ncbi:hypothetical protein KC356_g6984 [Hortaea werneckii]|nr:hypothetical protein KC356_g6984 [Hortaea werneckii]
MDAPEWRRGADPAVPKPRKQFFPQKRNLATSVPEPNAAGVPDGSIQYPGNAVYNAGAYQAPDLSSIQRSMPLPKKYEYPKATKDLFEPFGGQTAIHNICAQKNIPLQADVNFHEVNRGWSVCNLHVMISGLPPATTSGAGENRKAAKAAAWLHLVAMLHSNGVLRALMMQPKAATMANGMGPPPTQATGAGSKQRKSSMQAQVPPAPLQDLRFLQQQMPGPTRKEYEHAPKDLFIPSKVPAAMQQIASRMRVPLSTDIDYFPKPLGRGVSAFGCHLKFQLADYCTEDGYGEGLGKQAARQAAWYQLVAKMHSKGTLKKLIDGSDDNTFDGHASDAQLRPVKLDEKTLKEEKDAKIEIFNYAAAFGDVPQFTVQSVKPRSTPSYRRPTPKKVPNSFHVTVTLPALNLQASSVATNLKNAETAAAIEFKKKAEEHHAANPDASTSQGQANFSALNTKTAKDFFVFLKDIRPDVNIEVETENKAMPGGAVMHTACITMNGQAVGSPAEMSRKENATEIAHLTAAVTIAKAEPELLDQFVQRLKKGKGKVLQAMNPVDFRLDSETLYTMRTALVEARQAGLPDDRQMLAPMEDQEREGFGRRRRRGLRRNEIPAANERLKEKLQAFLNEPSLEELRMKKAALPMTQYRDQVLEMVTANPYSIVIGATGSGKTTQVPQLILEDEINNGNGGSCNIICTQPRRIAATSVAERVAVERNERLQESVGYHVRFAPKLPQPGGSITYCTTGILLEQLKHEPEMLDSISHILIDEVHERDMNVDFLMIVVKKALQSRAAAGKTLPKVVLMSATLDTEMFAGYFASKDGKSCPSVSVPGRTFPVTEKHLDSIMSELNQAYGGAKLAQILDKDKTSEDYLKAETVFSGQNSVRNSVQNSVQNSGTNTPSGEAGGIDWKRERLPQIDIGESTTAQSEKEEGRVPTALLAATIAHVCKTSDEGAILAFVPGLEEITKTHKHLLEMNLLGLNFNDPEKFKICLLHSTVPKEEQDAVFQSVPQGCRKIILSTNIAETSVTVTDVRFVLDTGKLREKRYDQMKRITSLQTVWVSRSNAKQRAGRAGRVADGYYYALFSQERHDALRAVGLPELLRSDLQEVCLSIKAQKFKEPVGQFLAQAIEPPVPQAIEAAVSNLEAIEAFTEDERLTDLGSLLAKLPIHPAWGKMIVLGVIFRCLDPMLILGAAQEERSLFISPIGPDTRSQARRIRFNYANGEKSDHLSMLNAFREIRSLRDQSGMGYAFDRARDNYIHMGAFRTIEGTARQIVEILAEAKLIEKPEPFSSRSRYGGGGDYGPAALNRNSNNTALIQSLLLAGVYPNLGAKSSAKGSAFRTVTERGVLMHVSSLNDDSKSKEKTAFGSLYAYSSLAKAVDGHALFMRDTTQVSPLMTSLFGGKLDLTESHRLELDDWLPFWIKTADRQFASKLVLEFRKALDRVLNEAYRSLGHLEEHGQVGGFADDPIRERFASQVVRILSHAAGRPYGGQWEAGRWPRGGEGGRREW